MTDGRPPVVRPSVRPSVDAPFLFAHLSVSPFSGSRSTEIRFFHTFLSVFSWSVRAALANPHCKHLLEKSCRFSFCLEMLSGEHVRRRISFSSTALFLLWIFCPWEPPICLSKRFEGRAISSLHVLESSGMEKEVNIGPRAAEQLQS